MRYSAVPQAAPAPGLRAYRFRRQLSSSKAWRPTTSRGLRRAVAGEGLHRQVARRDAGRRRGAQPRDVLPADWGWGPAAARWASIYFSGCQRREDWVVVGSAWRQQPAQRPGGLPTRRPAGWRPGPSGPLRSIELA